PPSRVRPTAVSSLGGRSVPLASAFSASPTRSTSTTCSVSGACPSSTFFSLSAIDQFPGLGGHAALFVPTSFEPNAGRLAGLGVGNRDLGDMQRRFLALEAALRVKLGRLAVAGRD